MSGCGEAPGVNVEQRRAWDGGEGDNWTDNEEWYSAAVQFLAPHLIEGVQIKPSDSVLDIGCGCGDSTREVARKAHSGSAFGIDLSRRMIERARERASAEDVTNVEFRVGDAQVYRFEPACFDVAISKYGSMFFDDPVQAFSNVRYALRPAGCLAMLGWREISRNEWVVAIRRALAAGRELPEPPPDAPSPFSLADPDGVSAILSAAGFDEIRFEPVYEPVYFGPNTARAFEDVSKVGVVKGLLADLDSGARREALERLRETIREHETLRGVLFESSSWLVCAATPH
jgi:SAM-dependent methyltransferase